MSTAALKKDTKIENTDMPALFHLFVENKWGRWDEYMKDPEFAYAYTVLKNKYGNSVFQTLVNTVAIYENYPIKNILNEFAEFVRTYY